VKKTIAYITDIHLDEEFPIKQGIDARTNWKLILNDIKTQGIKEIIFGGDIGEKASNKWFFDSLKEFKFNAVLGNHDEFSTVKEYYNPIATTDRKELYYAYEEGAFKYVFLDSSSGEISAVQFLWFKKAIKTNKKLLLFIHHPILPVATIMDKKYYLLERAKLKNELWALENEVVVFCGHYHMIDDCTIKNVHQILSPAASYQVEKLLDSVQVNNKTFGYRVIEIDNEKIKTTLFLYKNNHFISETI